MAQVRPSTRPRIGAARTPLLLIVTLLFVLAATACGDSPPAGTGGGASAGHGGDGSDAGGTGGSGPTETALEKAAREYCEAGCACYECEGVEKCLAEFGEPTKRGNACDALLAEQLACAKATMDGCPANYDAAAEMIGCTPPADEQEAACGPGGIPG